MKSTGRLKIAEPDSADDDLRAAMSADGYLYFRSFLPISEVSARRDLLIELLRRHRWIERGELLTPRVPVSRIGSPSFYDLLTAAMTSESLHTLPQNHRLLEFATKLVENRPFVHPRKMVRVAYPTALNPQDSIPGHQDLYYVRGESQTFTFWIPFGNYPIAHGGLWIAPGSHKMGLLPVAPNAEGRFRCSAVTTEAALARHSADFQMGDVLVFHSMTIHGSDANLSSAVRLSMDFRYSSAAGLIHPDELLPPYYPHVPAWPELSRGWKNKSLIDVPATLRVDHQPLERSG